MPDLPVSVQSDRDQYRPRLHFTPEKNWINDPNGLVWHDGRFHLYYQYNPYGATWRHMHWGHAESEDLVRWRHLPIALFPDRLGTIFSGSAVTDRENKSGLFAGAEGGLAAVFTYFKWGLQRQGIATSADGGMTWEKYPGNPVIPNPFLIHFRDPKVFFHKETHHWIMVMTVGGHVRLYRSADLRRWEHTGDFGKGHGSHRGVWECPDLFELAVDGDDADRRWVLVVSVNEGAPAGGSGTQYFIGRFDGTRFEADDPPGTVRWLDFGSDNYAGITFNDVPAEDGRRIFIGWMSNWRYAAKTPTAPWRGAMTLPRVLSLVRRNGEIVLVSEPVGELTSYRTGGYHLADERMEGRRVIQRPELADGVYEITVKLKPDENGDFAVELFNDRGELAVISLDVSQRYLVLDRTRSGRVDFSRRFAGVHRAPISSGDNGHDIRIIADRCSVEVFADGGRTVLTDLVFPSAPYDRIGLVSHGGPVGLASFSVWGLGRQ